MTPKEFMRECTMGRMTPDRIIWLFEQYPELRETFVRFFRRFAELVEEAVDREAKATVEEAESILRG